MEPEKEAAKVPDVEVGTGGSEKLPRKKMEMQKWGPRQNAEPASKKASSIKGGQTPPSANADLDIWNREPRLRTDSKKESVLQFRPKPENGTGKSKNRT